MSAVTLTVEGPAEPIGVRFTTSYWELVAALRAINRAVPFARRLRRIAWIALGIIFLLILARVLSPASAMGLLFFPALVLFLLWAMPFQLAWMTRRRSPYWTGSQFFEFTADGIRVGTADSESVLDWDAIMRTAEDRRFFVFFSSDQGGHFIPKRVLEHAEVARLQELFQANAGKASESPLIRRSESAPPVVEVRFELEPAEAARVGMVAARKAGGLWVSYAIIAAISLWTTVPTAYTQWQRGGWGTVSLPLIALGLTPLLIIVVGLPLLARWAARRTLRTGPSTRGVQHVGVAEWGIRVAGPMYSGELRWPAFMRAAETEEFILFFVSKLQPIFIPKRLLSGTDVQRVRSLVRTGMGAKADLSGSEA